MYTVPKGTPSERRGWITLLEKFWWTSLHVTYCKSLCGVKFSQIKENGRQFSHIELSNIYLALSDDFSDSVCGSGGRGGGMADKYKPHGIAQVTVSQAFERYV